MKIFSSILVATSIVLMGCAGTGPHVSGGGLFTSISGPITATASTKATKEGEACASNILGLIATGDNSINAAKEVGGIKKVASVDYTNFSILGSIYQKVCTIVKGA